MWAGGDERASAVANRSFDCHAESITSFETRVAYISVLLLIFYSIPGIWNHSIRRPGFRTAS